MHALHGNLLQNRSSTDTRPASESIGLLAFDRTVDRLSECQSIFCMHAPVSRGRFPLVLHARKEGHPGSSIRLKPVTPWWGEWKGERRRTSIVNLPYFGSTPSFVESHEIQRKQTVHQELYTHIHRSVSFFGHSI